MAARSKETMERDILEAVYEFGAIRHESRASQVLADTYSAAEVDGTDLLVPLTVMLNYLVEERFLFPIFSSSRGTELRDGFARGITPKGLDRLRRLRRPVRTWIEENWFPVVVAGTTALIGISSIVVNLIVSFNPNPPKEGVGSTS